MTLYIFCITILPTRIFVNAIANMRNFSVNGF